MKYTFPKNVIQLSKRFNKQVQITQETDSNITLFNPHMTAKPI